MEFEYRVCQTQFGRVTFVNGAWQGQVSLGSGDSQAALDSCPEVWDYLTRAGASGWELIAAVNTNVSEIEGGSQLTYQFFLKRQKV